MKLPQALKIMIDQEPSLKAFGYYALSRIENHVAASRMEFFPTFTNHGVSHIEDVIQTAFDLIAPEALSVLTPVDAMALAVSIALHDIGMHLNKDGFYSLIDPLSPWTGDAQLDPKSWHELWIEFCAEAKRFDDKKLYSLFGTHEQPSRLPNKHERWDDSHYLLVGEFLRRHHPRLAHNIAVKGIPAPDGRSVQVCLQEDVDQRFWTDICGLIARSHGMSLRPCLDHLGTKYGNKVDPRRTNAAFLMSLIRISDYFQIQADRAPAARTMVEKFRSSISVVEWKVHQSIRDIHNSGADPEAIIVSAEPPDVESFLRLKAWLDGIQSELDNSWAILGEIYGRQENKVISTNGLRLRRVRSNIDDLERFASLIDYIPERVSFDVATVELLKLLVGPLYNYDASIGFRELVQNAIDAVRERQDIELSSGISKERETYQQEFDVHLRVKCDEDGYPVQIIIVDKGVGMTADTIKGYFLKAGASFRRSDAWHSAHVGPDGQSRVLRSGRFGVGALAAFLIGDKIKVTTRHISLGSGQAISFFASLDSEAISLARTTAPVGTKIEIDVPRHMTSQVAVVLPQFAHRLHNPNDSLCKYILRSPSLHISVDGAEEICPDVYAPHIDEVPERSWRYFETEDFGRIFWTYDDKRIPAFTCNGFIIEDRGEESIDLETTYGLNCPAISMFDPAGKLPINLQRNSVDGSKLSFAGDLVQSIVRDIVSFGVVSTADNLSDGWFIEEHPSILDVRRTDLDYRHWSQWAIGMQGFMFSDLELIRRYNPSRLLLAITDMSNYGSWGDKIVPHLGEKGLMLFVPITDARSRPKTTLKNACKLDFKPRPVVTSNAKVYIHKNLLQWSEEANPGREVRAEIDKLCRIDESNWFCSEPKTGLSRELESVIQQIDIEEVSTLIFCEIIPAQFISSSEGSPIANHWLECIADFLIPFDLEKRQSLEKRLEPLLGSHVALSRRENCELAPVTGD